MTMEIPFRSLCETGSGAHVLTRTATAQNRMTNILMTNAYNTLRAHHRVARALTPRQFEMEASRLRRLPHRDAGGVLEAPGSVHHEDLPSGGGALLKALAYAGLHQGCHAHGRSPDAR